MSRSARGGFACAVCLLMAGCLGPDGDGGTYLRFENPEITAGLDSLRIDGINAAKGDTLSVLRWHKGETFPARAPYPPGLEQAFTLLTQGYKDGLLVYQSRTAVSGGRAAEPVHDYRLVAPALPDLPAVLNARVNDSVILKPAWEVRPGVYRRPDSSAAEIFAPDGDFAWIRNDRVIGSDTVLRIKAALADSGPYLFAAQNGAGRDSMSFLLHVRHALPQIRSFKPTSAKAGDSLIVNASISRTDSLRYVWMDDSARILSRDSVLRFAKLQAKDTGGYTLKVSNASDSNETSTSGFTVSFLIPGWGAANTVNAAAQGNSTLGSTLDLDAPLALKQPEAEEREPQLDVLFVYFKNAYMLMTPSLAKSAGIAMAQKFESAKLKGVKLVKWNVQPPNPDSGRAIFKAGPKQDSATLVKSPQGFLVGTSDTNLVWVSVASIPTGGDLATTKFVVSMGGHL